MCSLNRLPRTEPKRGQAYLLHHRPPLLASESKNLPSGNSLAPRREAWPTGPGPHPRDVGSIPGSSRSPREGNVHPLQCSCLESPMTEEPGGLQSMGSQRVRHNWHNLTCMHVSSTLNLLCFFMSLFLGREDPLEWETATHSSVRA